MLVFNTLRHIIDSLYLKQLYLLFTSAVDNADKYPHHKQQRDSDSDSELSAMEHPDLELASSHSSDDDDDDNYPGWGKFKSKAF